MEFLKKKSKKELSIQLTAVESIKIEFQKLRAKHVTLEKSQELSNKKGITYLKKINELETKNTTHNLILIDQLNTQNVKMSFNG